MKRLIFVCLSGLVLCSCGGGNNSSSGIASAAPQATVDERVNELELKMISLETTIADYQTKTSDLTAKIDTLKTSVADLEIRIPDNTITNLDQEKLAFIESIEADIMSIETTFERPSLIPAEILIKILQDNITTLKKELIALSGKTRIAKLNEITQALINEFYQQKMIYAEGTPALLDAQSNTLIELENVKIDGTNTFDAQL